MIGRRSKFDVLRDEEVLELLRDEPELLAIADTIHATLGSRYRRGRRRERITRIAVVAALAVTACVLALLQPWSGGEGGLVADALAAIPGKGPVLHAVLESSAPRTTVLNVRQGRVEPERVASELWFDQSRDRFRALVRRQGVVVADVVFTPRRTTSFADLRVGGPPVDRALVSFASGYRAALMSGTARVLTRPPHSSGRNWPTLEITTRFGREQVTLDPMTLVPREIRPVLANGQPSNQVIRVLSLSEQSAGGNALRVHFPRVSLPGSAKR